MIESDRNLNVGALMHPDVVTLGRNDRLAEADEIMKGRNIRHIVVLDEQGKVCGVVSQRELYRGALMRALGFGTYLTEKMLKEYVVKEAMSAQLHTATAEMPARDAARLMIEKKIGCLPVLDEGRLVGIVTESDFLRIVAAG